MNIEITEVTSWNRALNAARWTMGKDGVDRVPTLSFKIKQMMSPHSPKRLVEYDIKIKKIPYCNAVHFVRHCIGIEKFQCTLRDDRNNEIDDRKKLPQDYPVNLWIACNAQSLQNISMVRICGMASPETRLIWNAVKVEMTKHDPIVGRFMVPQCIRCGFCPEDPAQSCRYVLTSNFRKEREKYCNGFLTPESHAD